MLELVRSKPAMAVATVAALFWALGDAFGGLAFATLSADSANSNHNLIVAEAWVIFVAGFAALAATCIVVWNLYTTHQWSASWEAGAAAVSTLIFAIGLLVSAARAPDSSDPANVVSAVGLGGWGVLLIVSAARRSLVEQQAASVPRQASLRLAGGLAVLVVAIGLGLPDPALDDPTLAIVKSAIIVAGTALLILVLVNARARQVTVTKQYQVLVLGLGVFAVAGLANAISAGIVFGPQPTLVSVRVGVSIPFFVQALAFVVLGLAAFGRIAELEGAPVAPAATLSPSAPAGPAHVSSGWPAAPSAAPPSWQSDPAGRHEVRWWDGTHWTEHVMDSGRPSSDPVE